MKAKAYFKALRLERWPRSAAIFIGTAAFFFLDEGSSSLFGPAQILIRLLLSFLLTWLISTTNYIVNEIVDAPYDAHHPTKRNRPLVKGEVKKIPLIILGCIFTALSFFFALAVFNEAFFFSLLALLLAGFVYNVRPIRTKDIPFLDSVSESANNPIRFLTGWYAFSSSSVFPPASLLICWWSFGNFLMVAKRLSEARFLKEKAADYRSSHKNYSRALLLLGMIVSTVIFFASYFVFAGRFHIRSFFYLSPLLLLYFLLFFHKTLREDEVMEEPEGLLRHPLFAIYTVLLLLLFGLSFFLRKSLF